MTILSVVQQVCPVVGVTVPTSVFAGIGSNRTMQEMSALATEMAQRIAYDTREWTQQKQTQVFTGDGVKTAFNLPSDYLRMLLTANVWRSTQTAQPMTFIADTDEWLWRRARNWVNSWGEWTLLGGQMLIQPVMGVGVTATFPYLSKNCITLASSGLGDSFLADADQFRLQDRLLKLGMIWQWKANKGSPYAEDLSTYGDALQIAMGSDKPAPIILGQRTISANAKVAYPFPAPTGYIP
jgi:hypothetical protein